MIRTLLIAAAALAIAPAALAQSGYYANSDSDIGITVQGQSPDSYVIRVNVAGLDEPTARSVIRDAAYEACNKVPSTGNFADTHLDSLQACVSLASDNGMAQLKDILRARAQRSYYASADLYPSEE